MMLRVHTLTLLALTLFVSTIVRAQETPPTPATTPETAPATADVEPQAKPIEGARDLLELMGIGAEPLSAVRDGVEVQPDERNILYRLLAALPRFSLTELHDWSVVPPWSELIAQPQAYRGQLYKLEGRVERVTLETLPPELANRYPIGTSQLEKFYRCEVKLGEEHRPAVLYALRVPKAWKLDAPIDERIGAQALFLKLAGHTPDEPLPVFVTLRAAWYPDTVLGDLGMDVGLFDEAENGQKITQSDRQCFYELLAAVKQVGVKELLRRAPDKSPAAPLFNQPDQQQGKLFGFNGTARRAVLVRVEDPEIRDLYGIDHYFEVELVTNDSQGNPLTFCVLDLPPEMPTGEDIVADVRLVGFFCKTWSYRRPSGAGSEEPGTTMRQFAPLLIGRGAVMLTPEAPSELVNTIATVLFLLALVGIGVGAWWLRRGDRKFRKRTIAPMFDRETPVSLNDLGLEDTGPVRFDNGDQEK